LFMENVGFRNDPIYAFDCNGDHFKTFFSMYECCRYMKRKGGSVYSSIKNETWSSDKECYLSFHKTLQRELRPLKVDKDKIVVDVVDSGKI
jgi:hypothetical protein